jgi:hypothetical protein
MRECEERRMEWNGMLHGMERNDPQDNANADNAEDQFCYKCEMLKCEKLDHFTR